MNRLNGLMSEIVQNHFEIGQSRAAAIDAIENNDRRNFGRSTEIDFPKGARLRLRVRRAADVEASVGDAVDRLRGDGSANVSERRTLKRVLAQGDVVPAASLGVAPSDHLHFGETEIVASAQLNAHVANAANGRPFRVAELEDVLLLQPVKITLQRLRDEVLKDDVEILQTFAAAVDAIIDDDAIDVARATEIDAPEGPELDVRVRDAVLLPIAVLVPVDGARGDGVAAADRTLHGDFSQSDVRRFAASSAAIVASAH